MDRQAAGRPIPCSGVTRMRTTTPAGTPTGTRGSYPGRRGNCSGNGHRVAWGLFR